MCAPKGPRPQNSHSASAFRANVLAAVRRVQRGKVCSYGAIARAAGSPQAARAVGAILRGNYDPRVPCHRVVHSDGGVGDYNRGGAPKKAARLRREGVPVDVRGRVSRLFFCAPSAR